LPVSPLVRSSALHAATALAALALGSVAAAQEPLAWDFQYVNAPNTTLEPIDLVATDDGGAVALSYTAPLPGGVVEYVVAAFDENGDVRWTWKGTSTLTNATASPDAHGSMAVDESGLTYLATSQFDHSTVTCLSREGIVLWTQTISPPLNGFGLAATAIGARPGGGAYVGGYSSVNTWPTMEVISLDAAGAVDWRYSGNFGGPPGAIGGGTVAGLDVGPSGEVLVYGLSDDFGNYPHYAVALALSAQGAVLWNEVTGSSTSYVRFVDGAFGPSGAAYLVREGQISNFPNFDDDLSLLRVAPGGGASPSVDLLGMFPGVSGVVRDLSVGSNGDVLLALDGFPGVARFDASGGLLPAWVLPIGGDVVHAIEPLDDGGALVSGLRLPGEVIDVRFLPAQAGVLWIGVRPGIEPPRDQSGAGGPTNMEIRRGARGNAFSTNVTHLPGVPGATRSGVAKRIDGDGVGAPLFAPAPANTPGVGGFLLVAGRPERSFDNLSLFAQLLPANQSVLFLASQSSGFTPNPGGSEGDLCIGGAIGRFNAPGQIRRSRSNGVAYLQIDLDELPQPSGIATAAAGETWYFQAWYRDIVGGANASNFTSAVAVTLQ